MNPKRRVRRYDGLRRVRQRQEDLKAQVYAKAVRRVRMAEEEKERLEERRFLMFREMPVSEGEAIDVEQQRRRHRYERYLARSIVEQDAVIGERKRAASEKHIEMSESVKLRKMMETLLDRSRERVLHDFRRQERYGLDEVGSVRAAQKLKS